MIIGHRCSSMLTSKSTGSGAARKQHFCLNSMRAAWQTLCAALGRAIPGLHLSAIYLVLPPQPGLANLLPHMTALHPVLSKDWQSTQSLILSGVGAQ